MTIKDAKKLNNGLYRIFWKGGGPSLASIGRLHDGTPWFAPTNWVSEFAKGIACTNWRMINFVQLLDKINESDL
jgi:hypothetical protein